jgi:hypothetical protein
VRPVASHWAPGYFATDSHSTIIKQNLYDEDKVTSYAMRAMHFGRYKRMTDKQVHYFEPSDVLVSSKTEALRCLEHLDLLRDDAIIAFIVSEDLRLLGLEVRLFSPLSLIDARRITRSAIQKRAAGVILGEVYRHACPWPSRNIEVEILQQELLSNGLELIDVLVLDQKHVRSRAFPIET